jgi:GNAT superfamily N-acetyltransferase
MVDAADGFIAVTPEYNYGMPAALKNALDYLGAEWAWKPIGFVSYGNTSAGTRSVQHAKQVVTTLRLVPLGATIALRIGDAITEGQVRRDPALAGAAAALLDELVRVAHALCVVPDLRSKGLGRWLLRAAEAAAEPDCDRIVLSTGARSTQNIGFYEREGFRPTPLAGADGTLSPTKDLAACGTGPAA